MNLTAAIALGQVEHEVKQCQEELGKLIDDYEYEVRRVEKFVKNFDRANNSRGKSNLAQNDYLDIL